MNIINFDTSVKALTNGNNLKKDFGSTSTSTDFFPMLDGVFHYLKHEGAILEKEIKLSNLNIKDDIVSMKIEGEYANTLVALMKGGYKDYNPDWDEQNKILSIKRSKHPYTASTEDDTISKIKADITKQILPGGDTVFGGTKKLMQTTSESHNILKNKMLIEEINRIKKILDNGKI